MTDDHAPRLAVCICLYIRSQPCVTPFASNHYSLGPSKLITISMWSMQCQKLRAITDCVTDRAVHLLPSLSREGGGGILDAAIDNISFSVFWGPCLNAMQAPGGLRYSTSGQRDKSGFAPT